MKINIPILERKIKIAVVGCGRISKNHFASIEKHNENLELVAVCDSDDDILSLHKKKYKVPGYLDFSEMIEKHEVDIVSI